MTGAEREQSLVCTGCTIQSLSAIFSISTIEKSLSQFRQKMNVYGLVRPSPDPQDEPELTNRRRASENLDQWEARTRDHAPVSAGRGEGLVCPG